MQYTVDIPEGDLVTALNEITKIIANCKLIPQDAKNVKPSMHQIAYDQAETLRLWSEAMASALQEAGKLPEPTPREILFDKSLRMYWTTTKIAAQPHDEDQMHKIAYDQAETLRLWSEAMASTLQKAGKFSMPTLREIFFDEEHRRYWLVAQQPHQRVKVKKVKIDIK